MKRRNGYEAEGPGGLRGTGHQVTYHEDTQEAEQATGRLKLQENMGAYS